MFPDGFWFTQTNLQDYVDCPRRFQLLYVLGQPWPSVEAEPFAEQERLLQRGVIFHRLVQRHQLGMNRAVLEQGITDTQIMAWWQAYYRSAFVQSLIGSRMVESQLSVEFSGVRLLVVYDLLVHSGDDELMIVDWKTYRKCPTRAWYAERVQTRLYLLVLAMAIRSGSFGGDGQRRPSLVYWCAAQPEVPERFYLTEDAYRGECEWLDELLCRVREDREWIQTEEVSRCLFCQYRSLCGRGVSAGRFGDEGDVFESGGDALGFLTLSDVFEVGF